MLSGVLLTMEVGIRKRAWRRAWRYPAYLWSLRWVYAVKKTRRLVYAVYQRIPPIHHCPSLVWIDVASDKHYLNAIEVKQCVECSKTPGRRSGTPHLLSALRARASALQASCLQGSTSSCWVIQPLRIGHGTSHGTRMADCLHLRASLHYLWWLNLYESTSFLDFVVDSQYTSLRVNLLSKPLL